MTRLQRHVMTNVATAFLAAFVALVLLMTVGVCMQLLHEGLDVVRLSALLPPVMAYSVPLVLPSAFLTAVILTFGRLAADNELIAIRAAGIHVGRVVHPVLTAGVVLSLVAALFQFETVPRAQARIKLLKYDVLKQMLLDRAALSWRRQFAFPPIYIAYESYRDGRMENVVAIEVRDRQPLTVSTAKTATVGLDPEHEDMLVFEMSDCVVTRFDIGTSGDTRTLDVEKAFYYIRVKRREGDVAAEGKYMPLRGLLRELGRLRERVSASERFDDAAQARKEKGREREQLDAWIEEVGRALQATKDKLLKYSEQEPKRLEQVIQRNDQALADLNTRLQDLRQQRADCARRLDERQRGRADLERIVELQKQQRDLLTQIESCNASAVKVQADTAEARRLLEDYAARSQELKGQVRELEQRRRSLQRERDGLTRLVNRAADQQELDSLLMRIHKRLAQAAAVFLFALVGIPLGIVAGRRSVMIAFGLSFAVVLLIFYPFLVIGQIATDVGLVPMVPGIWAGDALILAIGSVLMHRVLSR